MTELNYLPQLEEIITRYNINGTGIMNAQEIFSCLLGILRGGHSPNHVQVVISLFTDPRYQAKDVKGVGEGVSINDIDGKIPINGMVNFCEDKIKSSEFKEELENLIFTSHGYELNKDINEYELTISNPKPETLQTVCTRVAKKLINDPHNPPLISYMIDMTNTMLHFRERPNPELMELIKQSKYDIHVEEDWDNREADWVLEDQINQMSCFDWKKMEWKSKFIDACNEIFARYDHDGDGELSFDEGLLFYSIYYKNFPSIVNLNSLFQDKKVNIRSLLQEAGNDKYNQDRVIQFVLWHGYDSDLRLRKDFKVEKINLDSFITRLHADYTRKGGKVVRFEQELLSGLAFSLLHDEINQTLTDKQLDKIAEVLKINDLKKVFKLKDQRMDLLTDTRQALDIMMLTLRYTKKYHSQRYKFIETAENLVREHVKDNLQAFLTLILSTETFSLLLKTEPIEDYLSVLLGHSSGGGKTNILHKFMASLSIRGEMGNYFEDTWKLLDKTSLLDILINLILFRGSKSGAGLKYLFILLEQFTKPEVTNILEGMRTQKLFPEEFIDYIEVNMFEKPFPSILPDELTLSQMSIDEINQVISSYCGINLEYLDDYFFKNGIIAKGQSIGSVISEDARVLASLKVNRTEVAEKLIAILDLYDAWKMHESIECEKILELPDKEWIEASQKIIDIKIKRIKTYLNLDPFNLPENFSYRVVKLYTSGHHQDVFHPTSALSSYYLDSDYVGGSAECLLINDKLVSDVHKSEVSKWTEIDMENVLAEKLNSRYRPDCAEWDGIIYCSDMNPYLIRVACCFEGEGIKYRVDPLKLYKFLEL